MYYKEVIQVEKSHDLIDILKRWMIDFPQSVTYIDKFEDSLFSIESDFSSDLKSFEALIDGLEDVLDGSNTVRASMAPSLHVKNSSKLLATEPLAIAFDTKQANKLYKKMQTLFQSYTKYISSEIPSKRIDVKKIAQGSKKIFKT